MKRILHRIAFLALILAWMGFIPACNYRAAPTAPAVSTEALFTQAAQTIIARLTEAAPSLQETTPSSPPNRRLQHCRPPPRNAPARDDFYASRDGFAHAWVERTAVLTLHRDGGAGGSRV
jgi:hypothetical protein